MKLLAMTFASGYVPGSRGFPLGGLESEVRHSKYEIKSFFFLVKGMKFSAWTL